MRATFVAFNSCSWAARNAAILHFIQFCFSSRCIEGWPPTTGIVFMIGFEQFRPTTHATVLPIFKKIIILPAKRALGSLLARRFVLLFSYDGLNVALAGHCIPVTIQHNFQKNT